MKNDEYDKYVAFFKELGAILKEGAGRDWANRKRSPTCCCSSR